MHELGNRLKLLFRKIKRPLRNSFSPSHSGFNIIVNFVYHRDTIQMVEFPHRIVVAATAEIATVATLSTEIKIPSTRKS